MADQSEKSGDDIGFRISSGPDETEISQPERKGAREKVRSPFRLLLVSDLIPQARLPEDWSASSRLHSVDKHSFAAFMADLVPRLTLEVPNKITETPKSLEITLRFSALDAFHPEQVVRQVSPLERIFELRRLVARWEEGELDLRAVRRQMTELGIDDDRAQELVKSLADADPSEPAVDPDGFTQENVEMDDVDRILDMIDTDGKSGGTNAEAESSSDAVEALLHAVTEPSASVSQVESDASEVLGSDLDRLLADQLEAIMNHPSFRTLEAAWRGLKFLVDRIEFRENIQLDVLPVGKDQLSEAVYHQVLIPEHERKDEDRRASVSTIILESALGPHGSEMDLLEDLAETGESLQTPVIAPADPSFFELDSPEELVRIPTVNQHFRKEDYVRWNKLRNEDSSKFLALALPPFLLRYPYGSENPVGTFPFEESGHLWGSGSLAVAASLAQSYAKTGWPTHLTDFTVEDLPVRSTRGGTTPLPVVLPHQEQQQLADAGFVVLSSQLNRDFVYFDHVPTVHRPTTYDDPAATREARLHSSLPCQLFVARAAHFILRLQEELNLEMGLDAIGSTAEARLKAFLRIPNAEASDDAVTVEPVSEVELPDQELFAVRLRPPSRVLDQDISLVLGLRVGS